MLIIALKIALTLSAVGFWLFTQHLLGKRPVHTDDVISDRFHQLTAKFNRELNTSKSKLADKLLIGSSLIIDCLGLYLIITTFTGNTLRPLLGLMCLFGLRQVNQFFSMLPTPKGMIWRDPGVPSLFVTYGVSNDLFFSGHTALAVLGALELAQLGGWYIYVLAAAIVAFEIWTVLVLRAHWTLDVFAGAVTALWVFEMVQRFAPYLDQWLLNISL